MAERGEEDKQGCGGDRKPGGADSGPAVGGGLECQDFILRGHRGSWRVTEPTVLVRLGFEEINLDVSWQDPQRGGVRGPSLYTCPEWQMAKSRVRRGAQAGGLGASGGSGRGRAAPVGADTGREGRVWLLGQGVGEGSLARPCSRPASSRSQEIQDPAMASRPGRLQG